MSQRNVEEKIVFALAPIRGESVPVLLLGIPAGAWDHMKDGKTHTFDLTSIGMPVKLMLYGARDHAEAMSLIEQAAEQSGVALMNKMNTDFSIKEATKQ